jgi:DNA polymerase I-like protein with 3'-5' exonuclease and polymerase domains
MVRSDYTVLDLETTIRAPTPHFGATPMWPSNKSVMLGFKHEGDIETTTQTDESEEARFIQKISSERRLLVGHNLPFDLLYLMRQGLHLSNHRVWDTQKFYYIERGRSPDSTSLENVAAHYGIPFKKDEEVKERFDVGIGADEIDEELLREYLIADVETTEQIYLAQREVASRCGFFSRYVRAMMNALIPTTQMTYHGISFNAQAARNEMEGKERQLELRTDSFIAKWTKDLKVKDFNPSSPVQIGRRLWGSDLVGPLKETVTETLSEVYKSGKKKGQFKTKQVVREHRVIGLVSQQTVELFKRNKWKTDGSAQTIKRLKKHDAGKDAEEFVSDLENLRHLTKEISTYYKPYINYSIGNVLHPSFNHCVTATGRLSSSKPNFQNINGKKDL